MAEEKLLTVRETAAILGTSEKEVINLAESGAIPAYKVGGVYLRFKREQIQEFLRSNRVSLSPKIEQAEKDPARNKISDFFYFNDFYILASLLIILLLLIILRG
ncbi:MAG: helix-turn-helix domain-containing protein [Candidatus Omnitrophica bacterium]|nr:helix-turn-helix domain-containing protein [Candidatus Omnitrophota bacterium]